MAEPIQLSNFEITDFSGGKTDNYIAGKTNQFKDADNMVLKRYGDKAKLVTRLGMQIYDPVVYRNTVSARLVSLMENEDTLFLGSSRTVETGGVEILGPTSNHCLSVGAVTNYISWAKWNKHLLIVNDALAQPQKVFNNGSWTTRTLGLPAIDPSGVTGTLTAGATALSYIYTFIRADSYTIGTVTFREVSATALLKVAGNGTAISGGNPCSISGLPVLANSTTGNYNTATSTIEIYRTTNNGTTSYLVGSVTNGTTTFSDSVTDAVLQTKATIYTDGGVTDFTQADPSKYVVIAQDTAFYLGVQEDSTFYGNKIRQSIPGSLYASPRSYYTEVVNDITGGGVVGIYPIVFTKDKIYRVEGRIDRFGQGNIQAREVSHSIGCVSHRSIVSTKDGLYFAAKDGFYFTDGFSARKLSYEFNTSYASLVATDTQAAQIYGAYDSLENRIHWAAQTDTASTDNDCIYVAHLEAIPLVPFTTFSGGLNKANFAPSSLLFIKNKMIQGDTRGYILQYQDSVYTDPKIDTGNVPANWQTAAIIYDYRSPAYDFGNTTFRKWVPRVVINADNVTNLSMQISSNNDNTGIFTMLAEVLFSGSQIWGDTEQAWGDVTQHWNYNVVISHWRRFISPLRCVYKQIRMSNSYTLIESYSSLGTASTNANLGTMTMDDVTKSFSSSAVDYFVSFDNDNYGRQFLVTARNSATSLTLDNSLSDLTTVSGRNWKMYGYKKGQVFTLLSYVVEYAPISMTQTSARTQGS